jgi:hypothetical protein
MGEDENGSRQRDPSFPASKSKVLNSPARDGRSDNPGRREVARQSEKPVFSEKTGFLNAINTCEKRLAQLQKAPAVFGPGFRGGLVSQRSRRPATPNLVDNQVTDRIGTAIDLQPDNVVLK